MVYLPADYPLNIFAVLKQVLEAVSTKVKPGDALHSLDIFDTNYSGSFNADIDPYEGPLLVDHNAYRIPRAKELDFLPDPTLDLHGIEYPFKERICKLSLPLKLKLISINFTVVQPIPLNLEKIAASELASNTTWRDTIKKQVRNAFGIFGNSIVAPLQGIALSVVKGIGSITASIIPNSLKLTQGKLIEILGPYCKNFVQQGILSLIKSSLETKSVRLSNPSNYRLRILAAFVDIQFTDVANSGYTEGGEKDRYGHKVMTPRVSLKDPGITHRITAALANSKCQAAFLPDHKSLRNLDNLMKCVQKYPQEDCGIGFNEIGQLVSFNPVASFGLPTTVLDATATYAVRIAKLHLQLALDGKNQDDNREHTSLHELVIDALPTVLEYSPSQFGDPWLLSRHCKKKRGKEQKGTLSKGTTDGGPYSRWQVHSLDPWAINGFFDGADQQLNLKIKLGETASFTMSKQMFGVKFDESYEQQHQFKLTPQPDSIIHYTIAFDPNQKKAFFDLSFLCPSDTTPYKRIAHAAFDEIPWTPSTMLDLTLYASNDAGLNVPQGDSKGTSVLTVSEPDLAQTSIHWLGNVTPTPYSSAYFLVQLRDGCGNIMAKTPLKSELSVRLDRIGDKSKQSYPCSVLHFLDQGIYRVGCVVGPAGRYNINARSAEADEMIAHPDDGFVRLVKHEVFVKQF